jgi:ABC-2 type transport system permease protein
MNFVRIKAIAKKEIKHLFRDVRMLLILLLFPVFLLIIFGYAINFDVKNIKVAVYDQDNSELSRAFINSLNTTEYFNIGIYIKNDYEVRNILDNKAAQTVIVIPYDFSNSIHSGKETSLQILIDGINSNTASIIKNYLSSATAAFSSRLNEERFARAGMNNYKPLDLQPVFRYNQDLNTTRYLIPGLIAMILVITAVISVSLSLVREKERGTIEQINVSPVKSFELLTGKTAPYILLALLNAALILAFGYFLFGVEVKGSFILLFITTLIFLLASTSIGIFISVVSGSQQVAFTMATMVSLLPSVILSGFIFPIESMPYLIQIITNITPAKFFITILRGIILRGAGLEALWDQVIYLLIFTAIHLTAANLIYKKQLKKA